MSKNIPDSSVTKNRVSDDLHFGHFADIPEYREANKSLIQELFKHLPNPFVHVDVATGTGLVPQLLIDEASARGYKAAIIGVDYNARALEIARAVTQHTDDVSVTFLQGDARDIEQLVADRIPDEGVDSVSIHDAIHEIGDEEDQRAVYRGLARIAKIGAHLTSNSSFTTRSMAVGNSLRGHGEWKLHFIRLSGAKRNRETETLAYRKPDDYIRMIQDAGFQIIHDAQRAVHLSKEALKAISHYPAFIEGFCRDLIFDREISLSEMSQFMSTAVDKLRFDGLPRMWHEIIGCKLAPAG